MSEGLNHWSFVLAAYAVTLLGTSGLVAASLVGMRRAEAKRDKARSQ